MFRLILLIYLFGTVSTLPSKIDFSDESDENNRYNPDAANQYHLYTRQNPSVSQPLLPNSPGLLQITNFDINKRIIFIIHGWKGSVISDVNTVLVHVILAAEDVNIIVVDWSKGSSSLNPRTTVENTIASGKTIARFINWINDVTGATPLQYHIIGDGAGGHMAGIIGRNVIGNIAYITGLNPTLLGWAEHPERFQPNDGIYTEVIHTNYVLGYLGALAQVDFYPNGGISMPGCDSNACDDLRAVYYFAESITTGGFQGRRCASYATAITSLCNLLPGRLNMGGLRPKIGSTGVYRLETNSAPPFSQT